MESMMNGENSNKTHKLIEFKLNLNEETLL